MCKNGDATSYCMSISQARKALGMIERNYSDDEILELLRLCKEAAEYGYEEYVTKL